jgi:hypothetical protein
MLKKPASFVLTSKASSTYPRGYASGAFIAAALLDGLFEHPAAGSFSHSLLSRESDDEPALLSELSLLLRGKHHERLGMAELTFFHCNRHIAFANAGQMLLSECQCRRLISRHHVEV